MKLSFAAIPFYVCANAFCLAETLHVAKSGDNGNPGSASKPFATIQFGLDRIGPGDTLLVHEGKYPEHVEVRVSGEKQKPITIKAVEGVNVTLDGGSITARSRSHLRIEGFRILNTRGERPAIEVTGDGTHVEIVGNEITGLESRGAAALRVGGTMRNFTIERNHVHHNNTGAQEAIRVHERTRDFQVIDNEVNDNFNIGIDIVGWAQYGKPRDGLVARNFCHGNGTGPGWQTGIYLDGPENIIVEYNISTGQEYGYQVAVEPDDDSSSGNIVRYNIAYGNKEYGIGIGGYFGGTVHHCQIYNNVFVNNRREIGFSRNAGHDNLVVNNIVYSPEGTSIVYLSDPVDSVIDHNCYFVRDGDTPGENSILADPRFMDLSGKDFRLREGSPCIGAGREIEGLSDIGAFPYAPEDGG